MRVLITGGFGLLGGRLAQFLWQAGYKVILGSRTMYSSAPVWLPQAKVIQIDWKSKDSLENACKGVDAIIHAAGMNAQDCAKNPVAALEFNGLATAHLLAASIKQKLQRFIYLSTAHVYASPLAGVLTEKVCPRNLHPYATSHLAAENVLLRAIEENEIKGSVVRLSNAFGAPTHKDVNCWMLLVNDLCRQAVESKKMVLRSSGTQLRDFVTITDVCGAIEFQLKSSVLFSPMIINIGSAVASSVIQMAHLIQQRCKCVLGFEPELSYPSLIDIERTEKLEYQHNNLSEMGFSIANNSSLEIDALLTACDLWFKPKLT